MKFSNTAAILLACLVGGTIAAPVPRESSHENVPQKSAVDEETVARIRDRLSERQLSGNISDVELERLARAMQTIPADGLRNKRGRLHGNLSDVELNRVIEALQALAEDDHLDKRGLHGNLSDHQLGN